MLTCQKTSWGITFKIFVLPRSSRNKIVGYYEDAVKIKLTAPPVDGSANKLCLKYLSKCLGIPKSALEIVAGQSSRSKTILIKINDTHHMDSEAEKIQQTIDAIIMSS